MTRSLNLASVGGGGAGASPSADPRIAHQDRSVRRKGTPAPPLFAVAIVAALAWGWVNRGGHPTAESGVGYYLGIAGALAMLLLLAYPLRKHAAFMRRAGPVAFWFRTHMALGLIGPTLILYHANFSVGSLNSNVALISMLIVAGSGLVGRYIYAKIHKGLYGVRAEMKVLAAEALEFRKSLDADIDAPLAARFDRVERAAFAEPDGMFSAAGKAFAVTASARALRRVIRGRLRKGLRRARGNDKARREILDHVEFSNRYFRRIEQAAELGFYERLFAAWHVLHLPLFILLILTAIIHVIAVHFY